MPIDETTDGLFSPRYSPLGVFPLWNTRGIVPGEGTGKTTYPEEDVVNDDKYADKRDPHWSQAR
jgi:hypothetical protein